MNVRASVDRTFGGSFRLIVSGIERFFAKGLLFYRVFAIIVVFFANCFLGYCLKYRLLLLKRFVSSSDYAKVLFVLMLGDAVKVGVRG